MHPGCLVCRHMHTGVRSVDTCTLVVRSVGTCTLLLVRHMPRWFGL